MTYPYKDNLIVVQRLCKQLVRLKLEHTTFQFFVDYISEHMQKSNCNGTLEVLEDNTIKLSHKAVTPGEYFALPAKLLDLFDFGDK